MKVKRCARDDAHTACRVGSYDKTEIEAVGSAVIRCSGGENGVGEIGKCTQGRARQAVRDSWAITQFAVVLAAAFAPVYVGILLPIGIVTDS